MKDRDDLTNSVKVLRAWIRLGDPAQKQLWADYPDLAMGLNGLHYAEPMTGWTTLSSAQRADVRSRHQHLADMLDKLETAT